MQISLENIHKQEDPYQLFLDSIKNKETLRKYRNALHRFLLLIPSTIYQDVLGVVPKDNRIETLAEFFVKLARIDSILAKNIIAAFIKEDKKKVEQKEISPNSFPTHIKPIKRLLDANDIGLHWKSLYLLYPREQVAKDRAYTREELQKMIDVSTDITDKLIIQVFSSAGFRLEAWDYFTWKDVVFFKNNDDSYKGAALLIYRGDPESHWTFITPEACKTLEQYREVWYSQIGTYPKPDDPLLKVVKLPIVRRLNAFGVKKRIQRLATKIGLRPPLPPGKKRHEVALAHGFRKYFNTMMRRAKVNYLDKEDMMGHKVGLERHYERYKEEDFERFPEYQKAIPFLTISDTERQKHEIELKTQQINELESKKDKRITTLEEQLAKLTNKIEILSKTKEASSFEN